MSASFEFFFDFMSPYSYLASTRVEALAQRTGATLIWRPFLLGAVFKASGNQPPISQGSQAKAEYLLKDLGDWTNHLGLPALRFPEGFPGNAVKADRLAIVALEQGKGPALIHALYRAMWHDGADYTSNETLAGVCRAAGMDPEVSIARLDAPETKDALRRNTDDAVSRGAFGAPCFFVGKELFVGNDRLMFVEAALSRRAA